VELFPEEEPPLVSTGQMDGMTFPLLTSYCGAELWLDVLVN